MEKGEIRPPAPSETPEPIVTKICMGDYVGNPYHYAKFPHDTITPLCPQTCENVHQVTRLVFFWFFLQPTAKTPALIFTINTSNDAVLRKDVPFGGPENKISHFNPIFPQKRKFFTNFR